MAQHVELYKYTLYYDIALGREITPQVDFLINAYEHYTGSPLESVLMLACGPGYHAHQFSKRGYRAVGLDLVPEMIELAKKKAAEVGSDPQWMVGDMRDFDLDEPVNLVGNMFDAIDALLTNDDLVQHFQAVARNLTPGGLYILEHTHPRDCSLADYGTFRYTGERDGIKVDVRWASNNPVFDLTTHVAYVETEMTVDDNGTTHVITDAAYERLLTPQEYLMLARLSGVFEVIGWHGDFRLEQPLDNSPQSQRMLVVMRKTTQ